MHVGTSLYFQNLDRQMSDAEVYKHELGLASRAEEDGFDSVWTPEHHFSDYMLTPNVPQFLAWVAGRTKRVKLGTMVTVLPWHDPIRVAESFSLLDHLSDGRAILGIGRGLGKDEFDGFRLDMGKSRRTFVDYSAAILSALETGVIEHDGEMLKQKRVEIRPAPFKSFKGRSFASAVSPSSIEIMARFGVGLMTVPQKPWHVIKTEFEMHRQSYKAINGEEAPKPVVNMMLCVHEDPAKAREMRDKYLVRYSLSCAAQYQLWNRHFAEIEGYEYYSAIADTIAKHGMATFLDFLSDLGVWGTPEEVADKILAHVENLDIGALLLSFSFGGMPRDLATASYELAAKKVLPILKAHDVGGDIGVRYGA